MTTTVHSEPSRAATLLYLAGLHRWDEVEARVLAGEDPCEHVPVEPDSPWHKSVIDLFFHDPLAGGPERLQRWIDAGVDLAQAQPYDTQPGGVLRLLMEFKGRSDEDLAGLLEFVLNQGAVSSGPEEDARLLKTCVTFDRPRCVDVLVAHGVDLHGARFTAIDNYQPPALPGRSPGPQVLDKNRTLLHLAAAERHPRMVRHLLARRMDPAATSEQGMTPLHVTFLNRWPETDESMRALLNAGAPRDVAAAGANGLTVNEMGHHLTGTDSALMWATALRLHEQDQLRAALVEGCQDTSIDRRARPRSRL